MLQISLECQKIDINGALAKTLDHRTHWHERNKSIFDDSELWIPRTIECFLFNYIKSKLVTS